MSKAARERRKRAKARKAQRVAQEKARLHKRQRRVRMLKQAWRGVSFGWKLLGAIVFLLGAVSQVYFFLWRLSVTPAGTLNEADPLATLFTLKNEGQFPVHDVKFSCILNRAVYEKNITFNESFFKTGDFDIPYLEGYAQTGTPCYLPIKVDLKLEHVDVTLVVSYSPSFYPFRRVKHFRFRGRPTQSGSLFWFPMPP